MLYGRFATSLLRGRIEARDVETHCVPPVNGRPVDPLEVRGEPLVQLDRVHVGDTLGEEPGQHAEPRADLEHDIGLIQAGEPFDHAQDVLVDQEVLPQRLLRGHLHRPKTASAFATIWLRISSPCSSARKSYVCATKAGSLRLPRTG